MRNRLIAAFLALASLTATACGGDKTTGPSTPSITGTWALQSINGVGLPFVLAQTGQNKEELMSDVYVFSGTGSFTQTTTFRSTINGRVTTESEADAGTYVVNGTAVTVRYNSDNSTFTVALNGDVMTGASDGFALVYRRQ